MEDFFYFPPCPRSKRDRMSHSEPGKRAVGATGLGKTTEAVDGRWPRRREKSTRVIWFMDGRPNMSHKYDSKVLWGMNQRGSPQGAS